jgi:uncharacterized protein (UPF0332 family)
MDYLAFKEKARQNLTVAEWCYQQGHYDACCNRAYYAMYHAAIAALANEGVIPSHSHLDHGWVQSQFVTYFCKRHKIFPSLRSYLTDAQTRRNQADYRPELLNRRKAKQQLDWASAFVVPVLRRIKNYDES